MDVTVYTTPTCGYCFQVKEFLKRQGVPFREKNVAADRPAAMEMVQLSGQQGVPVIHIDGQVVIGFDQPRLMQILKQPRPKLGASIADASSQASKHPQTPSVGAFVGRVRGGSSAEKAGLRPGDVITQLAGSPVQRADDVHRLVPQLPVGQAIAIEYIRDGKTHRTQVILAKSTP